SDACGEGSRREPRSELEGGLALRWPVLPSANYQCRGVERSTSLGAFTTHPKPDGRLSHRMLWRRAFKSGWITKSKGIENSMPLLNYLISLYFIRYSSSQRTRHCSWSA